MSSGLPVDLISQSAGRLRVLALLYAFVFFMAGILPTLLLPRDRARFFLDFLHWGPGVISIVVALLVAAVIRSGRLSLPTAMNIGLAFEIVSSYGIAAGEFGDPQGLEMHRGYLGLSWVAVWVVLFTVVVPTSPRRALLAALASVSSVPVIIGLIMASDITAFRVDPGEFFFGLVFPYVLVVGGVCRCSRRLTWAPRSNARASWGAIAWRRSSERVGWGRSGEPAIACWRGPPRSSSFDPRSTGMGGPKRRTRQFVVSSARLR
jgi:hypothetical protein